MNIRKTTGFCIHVLIEVIFIVPLLILTAIGYIPGLGNFIEYFLDEIFTKKLLAFQTVIDIWGSNTPEHTIELLKKDFKK